MTTAWQRAKWLILPTMALGCANTAPTASSGGVAIIFAALEGACSTTWNGTGTLPSGSADAVEHLTLQWSEADTGKSATARVNAIDLVSNGIWNVGAVPVSQQLRLQVYACTADNRVVWYGKGSDFVIQEGEDTTARVFMTPPGKLACTGNNGVGGALQSSRALSGGASLASGDAIVVGGADKWDGTVAKASVATDLYDAKLGTWRAGPPLLAPRIWPQVLVLDRTHVLVAGGEAFLNRLQVSLPIALFAPDDLSDAALAHPAAEIIDMQAVPPTTVDAKADLRSGARPFASAVVAGDAIVFAGGLGADGKGLATGARLSKLADILSQTAGKGVDLTLATARIQPGLLSYADGTVVVWGGHTSGKTSEFGELIASSGTSGTLLHVSGDAILADPNAQTIGATSVLLSEQGDILTFFVTGGIPVNAGSATGTPSYVVIVDRGAAKTAVCKKVVMSDGSLLPGGIGIAATRLDGDYLLVSGGLLSLGKVVPASADPASACQKDEQTKNGCMVNGFVLLHVPADLTTAQVTMTPVPVDTLAAVTPGFGQIALPLPVGALLAGGLTNVGPSSVSLPVTATQPFDATSQIVSAPFLQAASEAACKL